MAGRRSQDDVTRVNCGGKHDEHIYMNMCSELSREERNMDVELQHIDVMLFFHQDEIEMLNITFYKCLTNKHSVVSEHRTPAANSRRLDRDEQESLKSSLKE